VGSKRAVYPALGRKNDASMNNEEAIMRLDAELASFREESYERLVNRMSV
jgi:hypothetical protein